jgi:NAD(P)-dependent dehydrogenase (short-subunit alcohol dehydrogenase family)
LTSEKTGYPPSALSLDARLEADLGIDSIKRLEIVAALRRQVAPEVTEPPPWFARRMVSAVSLRDIVAGVQELKGHSIQSTRAMRVEALPEAKGDDPSPPSEDADGVCWRWMPTAVEAPPAAAADIPDGTLVVTDDRGGLAERFVQFCRARSRRAVLLHGEALESRASAASALDEIRAQGSLAGIVHLAPLSAAPVFPHMEDGEWQRRLDAEVKSLLFLAQALSPELTSRAESRTPTLLFAASVGGGQFAPQQRDEASHPWRGGLAGILKTAALEWPDARCRAADFDKPPDVITLWEELRMTGPVEIGYRGQRRLSLSAVAAPLGSSPKEVSGLDSRSVFLVTGGARGITAEVVKELSARTGATMVLLGRTEASSAAESQETAPIDDPIELRRVMARLLALQGLPPSALQIDGAVKQLLAQREVRRTLSALEEIGSRARYIQCDVRSYESLERAVRSARAEFGEITGVLHGAGVIEDRRLLDKTAESFDLVVGTKLDPIRHLLKLLDSARVRHVLLFSSAAAFWGNPGQADYAAANEILNRIGRYLSETWPGKTTAIGWGPWSGGGMVTPEVAREFARRGIPLVPQAEGRIAAWRELSSPEREARVLIGCGPWSEVDPSRNGRIVRAREECRAEVPPTPPKGIVTEVTLSEAVT